jgi:hypothetical protein
MNKTRLIVFLVFAVVMVTALIRGILLGDPSDMQMEASGL